MSVKLDWLNPNGTRAKELRLYRSLTPITESNPGTLIATLAKDAITYTDVTAPAQTTLNYQLRYIANDNTEYPCDPRSYGHYPLGTGPGPQTLLRGDWNWGYFGTVPVEEFYTADELREALGTNDISPAPTIVLTNALMPYWHKYAYKGKILFIPPGDLFNNVTWAAIYNKGYMYGTDDTGPDLAHNGKVPINQRNYITKGTGKYLVRTIKSKNGPVDVYYPTSGADIIGGEWDDLITSLTSAVPYYTGNMAVGRFADYPTGSTEIVRRATITQNLQNQVSWFKRGQYTTTPDFEASQGARSANCGWTPVLEYEYNGV